MIKPNVLYVDDLQANLILFQTTFERDYNIFLAESGMKALDTLKKENIQVLITDQRMPDVTGTELLEIVTREYPDIRRFLLTAYTDYETVVEAVNKGHIHGYLTKPLKAEEVKKSINNSLEIYYLLQKNKHMMMELARANEELSGLGNLKTEILKIMSHEIRMPLNRIRGTIHMLKDKIQSEELIKVINIIDTSVSRLEQYSSMAEQISALKSRERKLNLEEISLRQLVADSLVEAGEWIRGKDIRIDFQQPGDLVITADSELLISCFVNIINHAIRHTNSAETILIRAYRENNQTVCDVTDTGKNYSQKRLEELTRYFNKPGSLMDLRFGIELALAQLIMETHNGAIGFAATDKSDASIKLIFGENAYVLP
jgi:K+-sensing histidine kinase KdpD